MLSFYQLFISMKHNIFLILFSLLTLATSAQVVTTNPVIAIDTEAVTITFTANQGTKGLQDFSGDIYAHTGVITSASTGDSDWKYVKADWNQNISVCKLTRISTNKYELEIKPSIREFFGVPIGEEIKKIAFVFRSGDGSKEGKAEGGKDIFVDVSTKSLTVSFSIPEDYSIVEKGQNVAVEVNAIQNDSIALYVNDVRVSHSNSTSLKYTLSNVQLDAYQLKAIAYKGITSVEEEILFYTRGQVITEKMPKNLLRGANRISNTEVTVVLFAPDKDFVYLVGDFNNWQPLNSSLMKKDGDYFWLTLTGLSANTEYAYQFWFDNNLKIADPYTSKILDPWSDKYIPSSVYPNLKSYPTGKTEEIVSVFSTEEKMYDWKVDNFQVPDPDTLVIYELLVRDFTDNGDIKTVADSIEYFKRLGINAIELMPFNEFEGNDSWGYNPSFFFATDKAYGTDEDYKYFIDVCHQNGIAVLMDMVLNHSFGQSTFARMYLDGGKPALNNPWYNREHNMRNTDAHWGYDFNHESPHTKELVDSINSYWIKEFKIDGFRFDFTKGFTNKIYGVNSWASEYDASRIAILKRMADEIWKRKADAIISFEHLSDNTEEKELADYGILLWGNHNHNFNEATMGYNTSSKSDFSWANYQRRGWSRAHIINYMESHDEERLMYKNQQWGNSFGEYNVKETEVGLSRCGMAAAFLFSIPGPNMIWQFGELGYDYSINYCSDGSVNSRCRTGRKPVKWEYQKDENRAKLYDTYSKIIHLKKTEPVFSTSDFTMSVKSAVKRIELNSPNNNVRLVGNFGMEGVDAKVNFNTTGWWYNYFNGDSIFVSDVEETYSLQAGDYALFSNKKLSGFSMSNASPIINKRILVGPNPALNSLNINPLDSGFNSAKVINFKGQVIHSFQLRATATSYDISALPKGIYIIQFTGYNASNETFKFIKL